MGTSYNRLSSQTEKQKQKAITSSISQQKSQIFQDAAQENWRSVSVRCVERQLTSPDFLEMFGSSVSLQDLWEWIWESGPLSFSAQDFLMYRHGSLGSYV
jgi:hypothetical protein